jgi:hypothetical protein
MDPNTILEEMIERAREIRETVDRYGPTGLDMGSAEILADLVLDLDTWLRRGGCLPRPWAEARER